jgi:chromosome segregation ATPase
MGLRDFFSCIAAWFRSRRLVTRSEQNQFRLNDEGLMLQDSPPSSSDQTEQSTVKAVPARRDKTETLEKLQLGFDRLIDELGGINEHLRKQVAQHEELITHIDKLPKLLESFPAVVDNQKVLTEGLMEQLKANLIKDKQIIDTLEKIPTETAKQTDALAAIDRQLAAAADVDVQMTETFNKFNESLDRLNRTTQQHSDGISQMSRTFAAGDRYLKYIVTRQNRQFMWVFYTAIIISVVTILILVGIILYLAR